MVAGGGRNNNAVDNFFILHSGVEYSSNVPEILEKGDAARGEWPISMWLSFWNSIRNYCDTVPGYKEELEARRPGASTFHFDFLNPEDENFVFAPVSVATGNVFVNDDKNIKISSQSPEFTTLEDNEAYGLDENPFFVNPTLGDYRLADGVTGCPDVQFEKIGRY